MQHHNYSQRESVSLFRRAPVRPLQRQRIAMEAAISLLVSDNSCKQPLLVNCNCNSSGQVTRRSVKDNDANDRLPTMVQVAEKKIASSKWKHRLCHKDGMGGNWEATLFLIIR